MRVAFTHTSTDIAQEISLTNSQQLLAVMQCPHCGSVWEEPEQPGVVAYGRRCCGVTPIVYDSAYFEFCKMLDEDEGVVTP